MLNMFSALFLAALVASTITRIWLANRQLRHVGIRRDVVPAAFRDQITPEDHRKAADYTIAKTRLGILDLLYGGLLLLGWTLGGGLEFLDSVWTAANHTSLITGAGVMVSAMLIMSLLDLPFGIYHTFVLEERFGFNRTTIAVFIGDLIKQAILFLVLGVPLALLALWIMQTSGDLWWFYVWAVWMGFSLIMMWAYPAFIAPLFNRFTPLDDQQLRERIQTLLNKCGFRSQGIFVMDGSRRSGHGNAYFTGFGNNKRIVFFDTLLNSLEGAEIEAVLAHELGHFKLKHVQKRMLTLFLMSLAGFALLGWLAGQSWFYTGLGVSRPSDYMALLLFMLTVPVFTFFLQPVLAHLSRKHEFEADDYAVANASGEDLVHALVKMYRENASTLTPDPLYSAFHDSHPPAPVRVAHISANINQSPLEAIT